MIRPNRSIIRMGAAGIFVAAGVLHSLYYIFGLLGGWEKDLWNLMQAVAGLVFAGLGYWIWLWRNKRFTGKGLLILRIVQAAVVLGLVIFVTAEGSIWYAGRAVEPQKSDYLLILGARVKGETVSLSLKARLDQGLAYLEHYPETPVLLSGGQGVGEAVTEAEAMKRYLIEHGVKEEQILKEEGSTNTFENLSYSHDLLVSKGINVSVMAVTLVTNDFHMLRSKLLADRIGLKVYGLPSATPPYTVPRMLTRECAALLKSFLFDR